MADAGLPSEVRQLVERHLRTMEHVEVLVLLAREGGRAWTREELRAALRLPDTALPRRVFTDLLGAGLLALQAGEPACYRFAPPTEAERAAVHALVKSYDERPVTLIRAVYERSSAAHDLADAFRIRREED